MPTNPTHINKKAQKTAEYYNKLSKKYDRLYSSYLHHTHGRFLEQFHADPHHHILDASAGTGILAREITDLYGPFDRLLLNDPAEKMLEKAKKKLKGVQNVEYTNCYCEELNVEPSSFDIIICLNSFHYYTDQEKALNLFNTFLKPGGKLYLLDWNRKGLFTITNSLIDLLSPENINSLSSGEMSAMLTRNNFTVEEKNEWSFRWWKFFFMKCVKASA